MTTRLAFALGTLASDAGRDLRRHLDRFKGAPFDDRFYGS